MQQPIGHSRDHDELYAGGCRAGAVVLFRDIQELRELTEQAKGRASFELFGHVKGAFTGAVTTKVGRFELADGGTLFLDELSDISPAIQVKLLRVLQEYTFERVGESRPRTVEVRIIAATNRDLRHLIAEGKFREDLFYRLKVVPISLPPLRERTDDIPLLVAHFVERFRKETGKPITGVTPDAMSALLDHAWPGNVRELENAIEHAFVRGTGTEIALAHLPREVRGAPHRLQAGGENLVSGRDTTLRPDGPTAVEWDARERMS